MNGIDAVAMAFGQDWRAIEAAAHAFPYYSNYFNNNKINIKFLIIRSTFKFKFFYLYN